MKGFFITETQRSTEGHGGRQQLEQTTACHANTRVARCRSLKKLQYFVALCASLCLCENNPLTRPQSFMGIGRIELTRLAVTPIVTGARPIAVQSSEQCEVAQRQQHTGQIPEKG